MKIILLLAAVAVVTVDLKREAAEIGKDGINGIRAKRHVLLDYGNWSLVWDHGVFYTFDTADEAIRDVFRMAVKVWSDNTCVNFIENRRALHKVIVQKSTGCTKSIGRVRGDQTVCLTETSEGTAVHEIGHVLGLLHTMQRYDRNNFTTVFMNNIDQRFQNDFIVVRKDLAEVYGLRYDYGSIMHHNEMSYSINGRPTIYANDRLYQKTMGSKIISFTDIFVVNKRYGCLEKCKKSTSAQCKNEGYPHPRNCSICLCPSGYGGALCDQRPPGCGSDLEAAPEGKTLEHRIGYGLVIREQFTFCNFVIKAPRGRKIEVELVSLSLGYDNPGCTLGGVEIKAQQDQKVTGYRFCAKNGTEGRRLVSSSNHLPIILFNRFTYMDVVLSYRYI